MKSLKPILKYLVVLGIFLCLVAGLLPFSNSTKLYAKETVVPKGEDQFPSHQIDGAYWYNAVWGNLDSPYYSKSRVVEDRCLPARSFFIPVKSEQEAQNSVDGWRDFSTWQSLNGEWDFKLVSKPDQVITDFYKPEFSATDAGFSKIAVPSCWQLVPNEIGDEPMYSNWYYHWSQKGWLYDQGEPNVPGERFRYSAAYAGTAPKNYNPVGHYLRDFTLKEEYKDDDIILNFQGVESAFYVYVNGHYVGYSEDSFTQHEFDITPYVNRDGNNRLAVLVYRFSDGSLLENQDLVNYSGIFRDLGLIYRSKTAAVLDFSNEMVVANNGSATLMTRIKTSAKDGELLMRLYAPDGSLVSEDVADKQEDGAFFSQIEVPNANLWSPENPVLYHQVLVLKDAKGTVCEYVPWDVGLREVSLINVASGKTTYALNGQRIVFKGVNRHELDNANGRVMSLETLHKDLQLMRQHNVNSIRCSHYPNCIDLYIWADRYGLMILDEANMETHAAGGLGGIPMAVETFRYPSIHRCANMYERSKNFSSVVGWSNGNECIFFAAPAVNDKYSFHLMYNYIKERDKQRPVVLERDPREGVSDIRSRMYWPASEHSIGYSIFEGIEGNDKKVLESSDTRPYFQVEYAHSMGNSLGYYKEYWDLWRQYEHSMGGFIWDWVDQSPLWPIPQDKTATGPSYTADGTKVKNGGTHYYAYGGDWAMDKNNNFNNFMDNGLISSDRTPHHSHQQLKYVQQDVLFSDYDPTTGSIKVKNEFSFTPLANYQLVVSLLKDGMPLTLNNGSTEQEIAGDVAPASSGTLTLPTLAELVADGANILQDKNALYHLRIDAKLKHDVGMWGKQGDSIAFEQFKLNDVDKESFTLPLAQNLENRVEENDQHLAISNSRLHFVLDKKLGQWTEFAKDGVNFFAKADDNTPKFLTTDKREMLPGMYANFWRAPVDNDRENGWLSRVSRWREANFWRKSVEVKVDNSDPKRTRVQVFSKLDNNSDLTESYIIYADGQIHYEQSLDPTRRSEIPAVGVMFELPQTFNQLQYFGRGPATSFVDRWEGYPMGIYSETVDENSLGDYVKPQENGNHVGVEWAQLTNAQGQGLFVKSSAGALEVMASPYNQYDVTGASHPYELQTTERSYFRVNLKTAGVGGENSWGARPLPYAEIEAKPYNYSFDIFPLTGASKETGTTENNDLVASALALDAGATTTNNAPAVVETYPEDDPSKLYRVTRNDAKLIKKAEYRVTENGKLKPVPSFSEERTLYEIKDAELKNLEHAQVELTLDEKLTDFNVVYSDIYDQANKVRVIIANIVNKELPKVVIGTYQFRFKLADNVKPEVIGAQIRYNATQDWQEVAEFAPENPDYSFPYQHGQILEEADAKITLSPDSEEKYHVEYQAEVRTQGLLRIKTVKALIFAKDADIETAKPLAVYTFAFESNPMLDAEIGDWLDHVEIQLTPTSEVNEFTEFDPDTYSYTIPAIRGEDHSEAEVNFVLTETGEARYDVSGEKQLNEETKELIYTITLTDRLNAEVFHTYTFHFPASDAETPNTETTAEPTTLEPTSKPTVAPTTKATTMATTAITTLASQTTTVATTTKPESHLPTSMPSNNKPTVIPGYPEETQPHDMNFDDPNEPGENPSDSDTESSLTNKQQTSSRSVSQEGSATTSALSQNSVARKTPLGKTGEAGNLLSVLLLLLLAGGLLLFRRCRQK